MASPPHPAKQNGSRTMFYKSVCGRCKAYALVETPSKSLPFRLREAADEARRQACICPKDDAAQPPT